ncbi:hypothetical protein LUZ60_003314 [Juncus effusus]|nr:hypothetical protein LUZ60_003314 [Juncus effusus]
MNFSTVGCKSDDIHEFNVGNLISLRNLKFYLHDRLKLVGVGRLTSLQDIGTNYYVGESGCKISELKDLIELTDLSISDIGYVGSIKEASEANLIKEASEANLSNKENLQRLCVSWNYCNSEGKDTEFDEELLDHLKPHFHLNTLSINYHCGRRPPIWMKTPSDFQLVKLSLSYCKWEYLPVLEELPFLKFLELSDMDALKKVCHNCSGASQAVFPSLEKLHLKGIPELEEWSLRGEPSIWMPNLRNLTVRECPKLNCLPPLPLSLERLDLFKLGLVALPEIWHDRNKSQSSPSLVQLSIDYCSKLASLSGGMFEHPEYFTALHMLNIRYCKELMHLPQGGFSKFVALNELSIVSCPLVRGHMVLPEYFPPSSLEKLVMYLIGSSDVAFSIALEHVDSIVSLDIGECTVTSLTSKGVFGRWKNLREVRLTRCEELLSLECLKFCSLDLLHVGGCSKLISAIPSQSELQKSEIEKMKEEGTSSQADIITTETPTDFRKWFLVCSTCLRNFLALCTVMFSVLRFILSKLLKAPTLRTVSTPIGSEEETEIPSFSVNGLVIDDPSLLNVEPLRSLASVQTLKITDCSKIKTLPVQWLLQNRNSLQDIHLKELFSLESLPVELQSLSSLRNLTLDGAFKLESLPELPPRLERLTLRGASKLESLPELPPRLKRLALHGASKLESLPELPPRLEKITIGDASEELRRRCRKTGEDWPKLAGKRVVFEENGRNVEIIYGRPEAMKNESAEW